MSWCVRQGQDRYHGVSLTGSLIRRAAGWAQAMVCQTGSLVRRAAGFAQAMVYQTGSLIRWVAWFPQAMVCQAGSLVRRAAGWAQAMVCQTGSLVRRAAGWAQAMVCQSQAMLPHGLGVKNRNSLQRIVRIASKITAVPQRDLALFCEQQILWKARSILTKDHNFKPGIYYSPIRSSS